MSRFPGTSRSLGCVKQGAVYARGGLRCAWCAAFLATRHEATVDHLNHDHRDNRADNLAPACRPCNTQRRWAGFALWLAGRGASVVEALFRIRWQSAAPLPMSAGALVARRWHPERMAYEERRARIKAARRAERMNNTGARRLDKEAA